MTTYTWNGGTSVSDTNYGDAANWDDVTDNLNPAASPPYAEINVSFLAGGGTITGTGNASAMLFSGSGQWVLNGADLNSFGSFFDSGSVSIENAGTVVNQGTVATIDGTGAVVSAIGAGALFNAGSSLVVGLSSGGALSAADGGTVVATLTTIGANGSLIALDGGYISSLGLDVGSSSGHSTISIDATSAIEIGPDGTGAAGALTIDAFDPSQETIGPSIDVNGDTTIYGDVVDDGMINVGNLRFIDGATLEIAGSITGTGGITVSGGIIGPQQASGLQFDSSVASGISITFSSPFSIGQGQTLRLLDPIGFAGTLSGFTGLGDALVLVGQTVTAASISGNSSSSTLTATLASGGTLAFDLSDTPASTHLTASGSDIVVSQQPTLVWTGVAGDGNFGNAANWDDITNNLNPAASPPGASVAAELLSGGGSITSGGNVGALTFAGSVPWSVSGGAVLNDAGGIVDKGALAIGAGSTIVDTGGSIAVSGTNGAAASVAVSGAGALLSVSGGQFPQVGALIIGGSGEGSFSASNGGTVLADTLIMGSSGSSALVSVDATSKIEIGTAGTGAVGALTIDSGVLSFSHGDGTIVGNLVNNGMIWADGESGDGTLEVTGSVSGYGQIDIETGSTFSYNGTVTTTPAAVLQLDTTVADGATVNFSGAENVDLAPTLRLLDPNDFKGSISDFTAGGEALVLVGETISGATIVPDSFPFFSTLVVTLAGGRVLDYNLIATPATTELTVSGSDILVGGTPTETWTGNANTNFSDAANWNDVTDNINPAETAPGSLVTAEFLSGGGTITGTGTAGQLQFEGTAPWILANNASLSSVGGITDAGTLLIEAGSSIVDTSGTATVSGGFFTAASLVVSGGAFSESGNLAIGDLGEGIVSVLNGGSVIATGLDVGGDFQRPGTVIVDATSRLEIGTAGTGAVGAVTVDPANGTIYPSISGNGTIDSNIINNGSILANVTENTLEIVGSVSGNGWSFIQPGVSFDTVVTPGSTLQFDSFVGSGQDVEFLPSPVKSVAPTLRLLDPSEFQGTLYNFADVGDTLDLVGETIVGATIEPGQVPTNSTLVVTLGSGGQLDFNLNATPATIEVSTSGSDVVVGRETEEWTGSANTNFGDAANWNDVSDNLNPGTSAPSIQVTAEFLTGGGTISGDGTAGQLVFGGSTPWALSSGAVLNDEGGVVDNGALTIQAGASIVDTGPSLVLMGTSAAPASIVVSGTDSLLEEVGGIQLPTSSGASLSAINGGSVVTSNLSVGAGFDAEISIDAVSKMEIGTAGTGETGALTIDGLDGTLVPSVNMDGTVAANLVNNGQITTWHGGTFEVTGSVSGSGQIDLEAGSTTSVSGTLSVVPGAVLQLDSTVTSGTTIDLSSGTLAGEAPTLRLLDPDAFDGTLFDFTGIGDTLDLVGDTVVGASIISGVGGTVAGGSILSSVGDTVVGGSIVTAPITGTLDITLAVGATLSFDLADTPVATQLSVSGSDVTVDAAPCFAAGTRIRTIHGDVSVEMLTIGDHVLMVNGRTSPIIWIGHRAVDCRRHPVPRRVWPVRLNAGAFGEDLPRHDLWLSPDHAVFVDGVLIPVRYLINGTTIAQVPVDTIEYYHVELPRHDVLLAEGLPAESYLDTGDRRNFANGGGTVALYPDFASRVWDAQGCAPLVVTGPLLEVVRQRVDAVAVSSRSPAPAPRSPRRHRRQYQRR